MTTKPSQLNLPPNRQWLQNNQSDVLGSLWSSFNIDLVTNKGKTRVSPRLLLTTDNLSGMGTPVAFQQYFNNSVSLRWAIAGKYMWNFNVSSNNNYATAFTRDLTTNTNDGSTDALSCDDTQSDMLLYDGTYLVVSTKTDIRYLATASGSWSQIGGNPLGSGVNSNPHMMCRYGSRMYVTDSRTKVRSFTTSFSAPTSSGSNFLDVGNGGHLITDLTCLRAVTDGMWVFGVNQLANGCEAFKWDGTTASDPNFAYTIPDANGVLAAIIKDDKPWIIDNNARLLYFNGGTFVPAPNGRLPVKITKFLKNSLSGVNNRWIHPNGMAIVNGRINILVNNQNDDNSTTIEENFPSGIWEYVEDGANSFWYHKYSFSMYNSSGGTVSDYGQNRIATAGALYAAKVNDTGSSANGTLLAGAQYYSDSSTTKYGIFTDDSNDTAQKYGYLVTTKIYSPNILDVWQEVVPRFKKFLSASDSIAVKVRFDDPAPVEATITWTSTTTFTTTTNVSAYDPNTVGYNPEVEVIQGTGGGKCAHITSIVNNSGTYTVTLDDTFAGASGTAKARFQFWKKIGSYAAQTAKFKRFSALMTSDTWIQLKVCMQFTGKDELDDIILIHNPQQLAVAGAQ